MSVSLAERAVVRPQARTHALTTVLVDVRAHFVTNMSWQRAVTMVVNGSATVRVPYLLATPEGQEVLVARSPSMSAPIPFIAQLRAFVYDPYVAWSRATNLQASTDAILMRDNFECAYCGGMASTRDHVVPKSRGGLTVWDNLVAACTVCNFRKRDRTPEEAQMPLLFGPSRYDGFVDHRRAVRLDERERRDAEICAFLAEYPAA